MSNSLQECAARYIVSFFFFWDFSLSSHSSSRYGPTLEEKIKEFFKLLEESCLLDSSLKEEDPLYDLKVTRSSIPARLITHLLLIAFFSLLFFLFACLFVRFC